MWISKRCSSKTCSYCQNRLGKHVPHAVEVFGGKKYICGVDNIDI